MPTTLSPRAIDRSTYVIAAAFTDETGVAVVPTSITWTLSTDSGNVINSRQDVSITPGATVQIVLTNDDLAFAHGNKRVLTINAIYNSTLGNNLRLRDQVTFTLDDLVMVP